jgi:hypothetical protein
VIRFALVLVVVFLVLGLLRAARILFATRRTSASSRRPVEAEMVRDPICGTWIDRRLAVAGTRGGVPIPVCSERCRRALEAS